MMRTEWTPSRRRVLGAAAGAAALAACPVPAGAADIPVSGREIPQMRVFDQGMREFMERESVPGASLAITRAGRLVYARSFGWADDARQVAVTPSHVFRIASITKAFTAVAVLQLCERGKLAPQAKIADLLGLGAPADRRWRDVTLLHLLRHSGGWDDPEFDPMFETARIAAALGAPLPLAPEHLVTYMLRKPMQFDPGSRFSYSNFGYFLLGRAIERASGETYEGYVRHHVMQPLGIQRMRLGRTARSHKFPDEVEYHNARFGRSVIDGVGALVAAPYGAWPMELMAANGGWTASAADLVRFAVAFDRPESCPVLSSRSIAAMYERPSGALGEIAGGNYPACGWFVWPDAGQAHRASATTNGLLRGTATYLMRRHDGIDWAVLFNTDRGPDGNPLTPKFRDGSSAWFEGVRQWPQHDLFAEVP